METDINKIISTCIRNDIKVYPVPYRAERGERRPECQIEVSVRGRSMVLPEVYKQDIKLYEKIQELYRNYYKKNHDYLT